MLLAIQETLNHEELGKTAESLGTGYEKPRGAQRSTEKAGATEGIQSAEEGGSALWEARARKQYWSNF